MKTPEEIKKGLEHCKHIAPCMDCVYSDLRDTKYTCETTLLSDALAYIQQLEHQLRDIPKMVPKWISMEEQTPEISDLVLVIANGKPRENIELHNAILIASYWADEGWIADGFDGWDGLAVSHWMPLPEGPKEG